MDLRQLQLQLMQQMQQQQQQQMLQLQNQMFGGGQLAGGSVAQAAVPPMCLGGGQAAVPGGVQGVPGCGVPCYVAPAGGQVQDVPRGGHIVDGGQVSCVLLIHTLMYRPDT